MAIGYIGNLANLQAGNQQVINSMAGLGQQIAGAIENHAQTQAAQAMLPALQQSYQQGMQKIANGDPNGMADIYGAAATASQIPLLQPFAQHALTTAQSANINAQHMARTMAYQHGKMASLYGQYGSGLMQAPEGMNPNWAGKQTSTKAQDPIKQQKDLAGLQKTYMEQMGTAQDQNNVNGYNSAAQNMSALNQKMAQLTGATTAMPLNFHAKQKALELIKQAQEDPSKAQENQLAIRMMGNDPANLALTPEQRDVLAKVQKSYQANPNLPAHQKVLQQLGIPPTLLQPSKNQQSQPSAQPATGMIPAASGNMYAENEGNAPETADEQEAVGGGEEEQQPSEQVA